MGKVRIKTIGIEEIEEAEKTKVKARRETKRTKKTAKGAHGGERVVSMAPTEEELARLAEVEAKRAKVEAPREEKEVIKKEAPKASKVRPSRQRSRRYKEKLILVDRKKSYPLNEALDLLRKVSLTKFDGTVELHINVLEKGVGGQLNFPHGTGKKIRVAIANDKLIEEIQQGKINFDVLLSRPSMMPKLARVAKILGPRGLMPNPKNGTIGEEPEKLAKKWEEGQISFKTETQAPIIHLTVGKLSMEDKKLSENIETVLLAIGSGKIKNITLKSTMSPGIKIAVV